MMTDFRREASEILAELEAMRALDAPTHGGRVLSYVYDSGLAELDELAAGAARLVQPVNGLDPTTFTSVAVRRGVEGAHRLELGEDLGCLAAEVGHHATVSAVVAAASASMSARRSGYLRSATRLAATSSAGIALKLIAMPAIAAGDWVTVWEPIDST